ncbi:MAG: hypothetical protein ACHP7P_07660 [Terriglobales bacterium]
MSTRSTLILGMLLALLLCALSRPAAAGCPEILAFLADKAVGATCFHADDLRVPNPATAPVTPANNSITTFADGTPLPGPTAFGSAFSFTPVTDLGVISNGPAPTAAAVPGIQVEGWFAHDPTKEARFLLRFPDTWNGKLVVAGASGTRSEFNGDWAWSDYVLPQGYAYASQNKGVLNLYFASLASATQPATDPLSCRLNPSSTLWAHFYDNDPQKPFTQWTQYMILTTVLAKEAVRANYQHHPHRTYAVGVSNGGYQVRRAMEDAPDLFDGGVDWEGTFIDPRGPNILIDLPPAIKNFPDYVASGFDPNSQAAQNIMAAGYPPDIVNKTVTPTDSLWLHYSNSFWEVTACQWQERFDPTYNTYGSGLGNYDYLSRIHTVPGVFRSADKVETTGDIGKPLITVAGTMDALLPIKRGARAYEDRVLDSRRHHHDGDGKDDRDDDRDGDHRDRHHPAYRLYEVQNGNHIEANVNFFPQLVVIQPHAQKAFDLLVDYVEHHQPLPASQCIPKGGAISQSPTEPSHCANLFVP